MALRSHPREATINLHSRAGVMLFNLRSQINWPKVMHSLVYSFDCDFNVSNSPLEIGTRARLGPLIVLPIPTGARFSRLTIYTGGTLWNNLPARLRTIVDLDAFKMIYVG